MVWFYMVWYGLDYNGLPRTITEVGGGSRLAWMTGMDDEISIMDYNGGVGVGGMT